MSSGVDPVNKQLETSDAESSEHETTEGDLKPTQELRENKESDDTLFEKINESLNRCNKSLFEKLNGNMDAMHES